MRLRSVLSRRPSAPMVISLVALFSSLGGVGYAAVALPANSVGTAQLRNSAVTYRKIEPNSVGVVRLANNGVTAAKLRDRAVSYKKIQPGAVGTVRANLDQLQARIATTCTAGTAIGAVDNHGKAVCNPALPSRLGTTDNAVTLTATPAAVTSITLPAGASYMAFANPTVSVPAVTAQRITITCTLTVGSNTQTRSATIDTTGSTPGAVTFPLQQSGPAGPSAVNCAAATDSGGALPTVRATAAIDALQIAG